VSSSTSSAPADKYILIVDDDEHVRDLMELAFQMEGFQVATAANGIEATQKIEARIPDLITADLMMPDQGGWEFLRTLQASGHGRVPVVVISASKLDESTIGLIRQEANVIGFYAKPVTVATLVAELHKHLGTSPPRPKA
jgi:two-component system, OmpR family, response regulator PrrA